MSEPASAPGPAQDSEALPSPSELKAALRKRGTITVVDQAQRNFQQQFDHLSAEAQEGYEHLKGLRDHYKHKGWWSYFLMVVMFGLIAFQSTLLGLVGAGVWDFSRYEWLLPALLVQNFAQVIGLAVFVVRALFKDQRKHT